ncbi:MAG: nuclear transport factor 2 family protein [Calditrichaeota bacterium]|nr:nuclear transport factor 2 family protein [Calditrichota bacterium]
MKLIIVMVICLTACKQSKVQDHISKEFAADSLILLQMIASRERAMIEKDIETAMSQFSDDATWINSQGYYFEGKSDVRNFHRMLAANDSLDYFYQAGKAKVRLVSPETAIVYYPWKMFWYKKINSDTTFREIGLMTLNARKEKSGWKWIAVTNQHTPWFYDEIEAVKAD